MRTQVVVVGGRELQRKLRRIGVNAKSAVAQALYVEGETIMGESKANWVPVDRGTLRSSGYVEQPKESQAGNFTVTLGFGGPAAPYAAVQHERLDYHHTVGRAKYLEIPAVRAADGMGHRVALRVRRYLETQRGAR